ncbi:MAG: PQQ-like beta-propeller repeat protein [Phycisphaerae bacterium]|nr:PQQ-like beta-propeller repeat protein [Phycisphaerae bacterium]
MPRGRHRQGLLANGVREGISGTPRLRHPRNAHRHVNEGRVYLHGARGRVVCIDAKSGREIWRRDFDHPPQWGYSASVLIEGDLAIVTGGGDDGALVALNKLTGKTVWTCGGGLVGYATPYPFNFDGRRYVVGFMGRAVIIADVKTGRLVWRMPWETDWDVNAATPIFHDGHLFLSSGYDHGSILLKLARSGDDFTTKTVWQNTNIRAKFQTPVLYKGYLYTSDEVGLKCVEFATGELKWKRSRLKHGTLVIADEHLVILSGSGELLIAQATPAAFEPITNIKLLKGKHWTVPTLYQGRLYVRNLKQAVCYDLAGK